MTIKRSAGLALALIFANGDLPAAPPQAAQIPAATSNATNDGNALKRPSAPNSTTVQSPNATVNAGNQAPPPAPQERSTTADVAASALALQAVTRISEEAIAAADRNAAAAADLFQKLVWAIGALGVIFAAFGISSIRSLTRNLRANAKEQVNKALTDMRAEMDKAVTETTQTAGHARNLFLNTSEATRYYTLAKGFAEMVFDQQEYFKLATQACLRAREAAEQLQDTKQLAWTYSFEALCLTAQKDFKGAVKAAEQSEDLYQRDDPTLHYNLACYLCLANEDAAAVARLEKAFALEKDGSMRTAALTEEDFQRWRVAGLYPELVGPAPPPRVATPVI
jgi:hypothetical protein